MSFATPRLELGMVFPRLELLADGHGWRALFPRLGLLLGWYEDEEQGAR